MLSLDYKYTDTYFANGMDGWHKESFPIIRKCIENNVGQVNVMLDFGCGDGFYGRTLLQHARFVDGADISPSILGHANRQYYRQIRVADLAAQLLGQESEDVYDVLFSSEVIEHVKDYRMFLRNSFALLRPGGKLILTTTTFSCALPILMQTSPKELLGTAWLEFVFGWLGAEQFRTKFTMRLWGWTKGHYHGFSKGQIRRALTDIGYMDIKIQYLHIMPVVPLAFFDNPFKSLSCRSLVRAVMRVCKIGAIILNATCKTLDIYAPNVIVVASKPSVGEDE